MSFNTIIDWNGCSADQQQQLLTRPAISASDSISKTVTEILNNVKANGDAALREYSAKFDKTTVAALQVSEAEIAAAGERLSDELKQAMAVAVKNIETFHNAQQLQAVDVETLPGVRCQQVTRPIASVGLYIPGGSAPLFSTVLMLATPARIAGCQQVVLCSPPPIADEILYAAQLCGVKTIFNVGGAQAIAALGLRAGVAGGTGGRAAAGERSGEKCGGYKQGADFLQITHGINLLFTSLSQKLLLNTGNLRVYQNCAYLATCARVTSADFLTFSSCDSS